MKYILVFLLLSCSNAQHSGKLQEPNQEAPRAKPVVSMKLIKQKYKLGEALQFQLFFKNPTSDSLLIDVSTRFEMMDIATCSGCLTMEMRRQDDSTFVEFNQRIDDPNYGVVINKVKNHLLKPGEKYQLDTGEISQEVFGLAQKGSFEVRCVLKVNFFTLYTDWYPIEVVE